MLYDADILIEGPKILKIGKGLKAPDAKVIRGEDKFLYPGLINTHHHFFQAFVRNLITIDRPNLTVMQWLAEIQPTFQMVDSDVVYYASLAAMADLIKHGCTTAFDQQYIYTPDTGKDPVDRQMEAARMLGMRFHAGRGASTLSINEGSFVPERMCETTDEFLKDCDRLIDLYHDPAPFSMRQIVIAPTQPISCKKETFVEALKLARDRGVHLHTHLCEGEVSAMVERWGKTLHRMVRGNRLPRAGISGSRTGAKHCRKNMRFSHKRARAFRTAPRLRSTARRKCWIFPLWKRRGILISLGTDGCSTNEGSSMLDALRLAYLMQTFRNVERTGCPRPYDILKIATVNGAKTLGRKDIGSLGEGMAADLFMIDVGTLEVCGRTA